MLGKRDGIFWAAAAIFVVALVLTALWGQQYLLLLAAAYLLRPTVHSLGFARKLIDERQMEIQYRASNVAFAALVLGNAALIVYLMRIDDHVWEMVGGVLMVGLAVRALAGLLLVGDPAVAGQRILYAIGLLAGLFAAMDAGFPGVFVAVLPGLVVAGLGFASRLYPRPVAALVGVVVVLFCVLMLPPALRQPGGPNWGTAVTFGLILVPLITAALCLWRGASTIDESEAATPTTAANPGR
jgi:hypothetical protein